MVCMRWMQNWPTPQTWYTSPSRHRGTTELYYYLNLILVNLKWNQLMNRSCNSFLSTLDFSYSGMSIFSRVCFNNASKWPLSLWWFLVKNQYNITFLYFIPFQSGVKYSFNHLSHTRESSSCTSPHCLWGWNSVVHMFSGGNCHPIWPYRKGFRVNSMSSLGSAEW